MIRAAVNDDIRLNMRLDAEVLAHCNGSYNDFMKERYDEMIKRRRILGYLNRWNGVISIVLFGCGGITAFIAGALNLGTLSIVSGVISVLGGVCNLVGDETKELCSALDEQLKSLKKYEIKDNSNNDQSQASEINPSVVQQHQPRYTDLQTTGFQNQPVLFRHGSYTPVATPIASRSETPFEYMADMHPYHPYTRASQIPRPVLSYQTNVSPLINSLPAFTPTVNYPETSIRYRNTYI